MTIKSITLVASFLLLGWISTYAQEKKVYDALASDNLATIDNQIKSLGVGKSESEKAYLGTLLMKKAGLIKGAGKKLKVFKEGREKLENVIGGNKENGEYRFLRLMIQENAPGILGYNKDMEEDAAVVTQKYKDLDADVKNAIKDYSKKSKKLGAVKLEPDPPKAHLSFLTRLVHINFATNAVIATNGIKFLVKKLKNRI